MASARRTRQLSAVYETVSAALDHPSAEDVYGRVRERLPQVSLGTVYRNLQKLVALRQLRVVQLANRAARYDAVLAEHDHFVCELCSSVTDLAPRHGEIDCTQLDHAGFSVRSHTLTFYGICPNCRSAGRQCRSRPHA